MKDLLCFGDSNTYGYDPESRLRYGFDERWTGLISRELLPYGIRVDEEGLCGRGGHLKAFPKCGGEEAFLSAADEKSGEHFRTFAGFSWEISLSGLSEKIYGN